MSGLIKCRKFFSRILVRLDEPVSPGQPSPFVGLGYFVIGRFAFALVWFAMFLVEIPLHLFRHTTDSFAIAALQGPQHEYQESYSSFVRRQRLAVVSVLASFLFLVGQLTYLGYTVVQFTIPTKVVAQSGTIDINPSWDDTSVESRHWTEINPCTIDSTTYYSEGSGLGTLTYGKAVNDPLDCELVIDYYNYIRRAALKFSLSSIPDNATITGVSLLTNVVNTTTQMVALIHPTSDDVEALNPDDGTLQNAIANGTTYTTVNWSASGAKNVSLGSSGISDVQSRIATSDIFAVGIATDNANANDGGIDSVNSGTPANRPILRVTYTIPPPAATAMNHSTITTSSVTWTWTDNATAETRYDVRDGSGNVTGCTNLAANSTSCTETGLSPNTQYTRTVRVTDAQGTSDSASASAYTTIQTPTEVSGSQLQQTSITVSAAGSLANLGSGQSALWFEESVTGTNSGWITSTNWQKTGLTSNTLYTFRVKARNGDGVETGFTATADLPTLAATPAASSTRTPATWYTSGGFPFTSDVPFGAGGIEYYRYAWNTSSSYAFAQNEPKWCMSGCDVTTHTLTNNATDGSSWYFHLEGYDATDNNSGGDTTYGPYYFDATAPTAPATVNDGLAGDLAEQSATTSLSANWSASTDATSGLQKYEYAIGTSSGGTEIRSYTDNGTATNVTATGLTLSAGTTYYVSVRAVDVAGNTGSVATSNGITITAATTPDTTGPIISAVMTDATATTATIRWTTNESATAKVDYGLTTSYGSSVERTTFTSDHQLAITGLSASTTYHFRIITVDASGNTTSSPDDVFTTVAAPVSGSGITGPTLLRPIVRDGSNPSITITGVGKGNQVITFYVNDKAVKSVDLPGQLTETKSFAVKLLANLRPTGKYAVTATSTQSDGRVSEIRQRLTFRIQSDTAGKYVRPSVVSTYVVHAGDSLWSIAERMLGDGNRWTEIQSANTSAIPSLATQTTILPGWALTIPAP